MIGEAVKSGAQVYITGDIKYNNARDAAAYGMDVIELSHFDSEIFSTQLFKKILADEVGDGLELFVSSENQNVLINIV